MSLKNNNTTLFNIKKRYFQSLLNFTRFNTFKIVHFMLNIYFRLEVSSSIIIIIIIINIVVSAHLYELRNNKNSTPTALTLKDLIFLATNAFNGMRSTMTRMPAKMLGPRIW